MALQSELLGSEAKLEAAATADNAHVTIGTSGTHVAKIQMALNLLGKHRTKWTEAVG